MPSQRTPILLILGPSGAGKSTVAGWLQTDCNYLWLEIDRFGEGDGIDLAGLRAEWDAFWLRGDPSGMAAELRRRASGKVAGVVLSFPSNVVPAPEQIQAAEKVGITTIVLYGTGAECLDAFLARERLSRRGLDEEHWISNNSVAYARLSGVAYRRHRLPVFDSGRFRTKEVLIAEVTERAG